MPATARERDKKWRWNETQSRRSVSVPGVRVMTQPWSRFRYATGTVVERVKADEGVILIRVKLDIGRLYDFPLEHIDLIED